MVSTDVRTKYLMLLTTCLPMKIMICPPTPTPLKDRLTQTEKKQTHTPHSQKQQQQQQQKPDSTTTTNNNKNNKSWCVEERESVPRLRPTFAQWKSGKLRESGSGIRSCCGKVREWAVTGSLGMGKSSHLTHLSGSKRREIKHIEHAVVYEY